MSRRAWRQKWQGLRKAWTDRASSAPWDGSRPDDREFAPSLLQLESEPPRPLGLSVLRIILWLLLVTLLWACFSPLDIVAVANGRIVPRSFVKIVQPAEAGIVSVIRVQEGDRVRQGQVLMEMDALPAQADAATVEADYQRRRLALRRIDAELLDQPFAADASAPPDLLAAARSQYQANWNARAAMLAEERTRLQKARDELAASRLVQAKLAELLPYYQQQEAAYARLARDGFVSEAAIGDKTRQRIEKARDLEAHQHLIRSAEAAVQQSNGKLLQIDADYRRALQAERVETAAALSRLEQERAKLAHRAKLLSLRAPQDGVVKDIATHTPGTVVQPGTVLMTVVPHLEEMRAEVWIGHDMIGRVHPEQPVRLKLAAFPFQKHGLLDGRIQHVAADAAEAGRSADGGPADGSDRSASTSAYRAIIRLTPSVGPSDPTVQLRPGMQVQAEILLGTRTVLQYLLSPLQAVWHEAGREP